MEDYYRLAEFAALLGEPQRARIVVALMDGTALPAGELARQSGIAASTASGHLALLVSGGILSVERHGRHRYYRISDHNIAAALESLAAMLPPQQAKYRSDARMRLASARTCYDHLAGDLGVRWTEALLARGVLLDKGLKYQLNPQKVAALRAMGFELQDPHRVDAALFGKKCLDCTQRRHHVGGLLGALLARELFRMEWVRRTRGDRTLRVMPRGRAQFQRHFALSL